MLTLPASARVACWINAWLAARESADAVISGLAGTTGVAVFVAPEPTARLSPALFLGELRRWGVRRASSALPVPGDPLGLGGPAEFNLEVIAATQGVVLHGAGLGLVPRVTGSLTQWDVVTASPPTYLPAVAESDRALRAAMTTAANDLARLDVASWRPELADAMLSLRRPVSADELAPFPTPQSAKLAADALRAAGIVSLAKTDDGGAVSSWEATQRAAALQPLDQMARAAMVAATSSLDGR